MKFTKKIFIIFTIISIIFVNTSLTFAAGGGFSLSSIWDKGTNYTDGATSDVIWESSQIAEIVKPIANALLAIGVLVLVGAGIVLGINYITGGPDGQATAKKQAIGLAVSAVVIFGAYGIWSLFYTLLSGTFGG